MLDSLLLLAFGILALADWYAVAREKKTLECFLKPAVLLVLLAYAASGPRTSAWLFLALLFSLGGDVFLLFPDRWFLPGLASFLLAHVAYLFAFDAPWLFRLGGAAALLLVTSPLLVRLLRAVPSSLRSPVLVYTAALAAMSGSALASGHAAAAAGGVLFLVSDGVLAWNRFVRAFPFARLLVMTTYHLAQLGLVVALR